MFSDFVLKMLNVRFSRMVTYNFLRIIVSVCHFLNGRMVSSCTPEGREGEKKYETDKDARSLTRGESFECLLSLRVSLVKHHYLNSLRSRLG